jgi:hypothetical protein
LILLIKGLPFDPLDHGLPLDPLDPLDQRPSS